MAIKPNECFLRSVRLKREVVESFEAYPFAIPSIKKLKTLRLHPKVTFLIGENGSGKSTVLEAIAVALGFNPEGGSRNFNFTTRASHSELSKYLVFDRGNNLRRPKDGYFFRAESYFNLATEIENLDNEAKLCDGLDIIDSYGGRSLHEQSHGESFFALLTKRFWPQGLYLLDEPEAALSPTRQLSCLTRIHQLVTGGAQFIIATHAPILMAYPHAQIYEFTTEGIQPRAYEETEHFVVTRDFLNRRQQLLKILMEEEE